MGEEDWIVEVDGPPPANSDMAYSGDYEVLGEPITCCETVKSPSMGDATSAWTFTEADLWIIVAGLAITAVMIIVAIFFKKGGY